MNIANITVGEIIYLVLTVFGMVAAFWKLKIDIARIEKDVSNNKETRQIQITAIETEILKIRNEQESHRTEIKNDLNRYRDDVKNDLGKFIESNEKQHSQIDGKLDNIINHLINK